MSVLTGPKIRRLAEGHVGEYGERIVIRPFDPTKCGPASYDVHLGDAMKMYECDQWHGNSHWLEPIDPTRPPSVATVPCGETVDGPAWLLKPGRVYIASTREYTETHRLSAQVTGRSSWGRYGLFIHVTAGYIDPGFCGTITLELVATQPIVVRPGDKIAQIVYTTLIGEYQPYKGRYQGDTETVPSRFHLPDPK